MCKACSLLHLLYLRKNNPLFGVKKYQTSDEHIHSDAFTFTVFHVRVVLCVSAQNLGKLNMFLRVNLKPVRLGRLKMKWPRKRT